MQDLLTLLAELERRSASRLFPDEGPLRRELYPKHMEFFRLGKTKMIRGFIAANRVGKTTAACFELACHLTGEYPDWWDSVGGRRYDRPIMAWAASDDYKSLREGIQAKLIGPEKDVGGGIIPRWSIDKANVSYIGNTNGAADKVLVKHVSGGYSELGFKTYQAGRESFQAVSRDVILLDEEPRHYGIFSESVTRVLDCKGMVMLTFTSLRGVTPLVMKLLPELGKPVDEETEEEKDALSDLQGHMAAVICGWADVPHLPKELQGALMATYSPAERKARTTGWPGLSTGMIYPVEEQDFVIKPITIQPKWKRVYALDPGWVRTAAVWLAIDEETDTAYLYSEYYRGQAEIEIHTKAIKARGDWIPGVSDNAVDIKTGKSIIDAYIAEGLKKLKPAKKSGKDVRMNAVLSRLSTGRLKVFDTCQWWLWEFRQYKTNADGEVASEHDHLMNATEYAVESGIPVASIRIPPPIERPMQEQTYGLYAN